jgi:hypothetical protein
MPKLLCAQLRLCSILRSLCVSPYINFDLSEGFVSEGTYSCIILQKHCQITFLRTFGSRRPPTGLFLVMSLALASNIATLVNMAYDHMGVILEDCPFNTLGLKLPQAKEYGFVLCDIVGALKL